MELCTSSSYKLLLFQGVAGPLGDLTHVTKVWPRKRPMVCFECTVYHEILSVTLFSVISVEAANTEFKVTHKFL